VTDSINYFGSASSKLIAKDFTRERRKNFTITREILWECETASNAEVSVMEFKFIRECKSNDPKIGYNQSPRFVALEAVQELCAGAIRRTDCGNGYLPIYLARDSAA
jgi:hypothetical protein